LTRYEASLEAYGEATDGLTSLFAGSSRAARLKIAERGCGQAAIVSVACGVFAPLLMSFVIWVLRKAKEDNLKRLYFVSRDGELPRRVAATVAPKLGYDCELRYLYGSRQAWHLPAVTHFDELFRDWFSVVAHSDLTVRDVLMRVGVTPEAIAKELAAIGISCRLYDRPIRGECRPRMAELMTSDAFEEMVVGRAEERRAIAVEYLRQEKLFEDDSWAIVDLGWKGRLQRSLSRLLALAEGPPCRGLYLGLRDSPDSQERDRMDAFLFDGRAPKGDKSPFAAFEALAESICKSEEEQVVGYERDGALNVKPLFRGQRNALWAEWPFGLVRESICEMAGVFPTEVIVPESITDARPALTEVLRAFWMSPSAAEARAWAGLPIESDQAANYSERLAAPYRVMDVARAFACGGFPRKHPWFWVAGARGITGTLTHAATRLAAALGATVRGRWAYHEPPLQPKSLAHLWTTRDERDRGAAIEGDVAC
jgi:hypothetical protein